MDIAVDTIYGMRVGFEYVPPATAKEVFGETANRAFMFDLLILNVIVVTRSE